MIATLRFLWALPMTLVGGLLALVCVLTGSTGRVHTGVWELSGGIPARVLGRCGFACLTLGYVTFGVSRALLDFYRAHERVHVRQCGVWGILFLPTYALASLWALAHGRAAWRDNWFEQRALKESGR